MTLSVQPLQSTVTQTGLTVTGSIKNSKIEVKQEIVSKDTSIIDQSGVYAFGLVNIEVTVSQSARGDEKPVAIKDG